MADSDGAGDSSLYAGTSPNGAINSNSGLRIVQNEAKLKSVGFIEVEAQGSVEIVADSDGVGGGSAYIGTTPNANINNNSGLKIVQAGAQLKSIGQIDIDTTGSAIQRNCGSGNFDLCSLS